MQVRQDRRGQRVLLARKGQAARAPDRPARQVLQARRGPEVRRAQREP